jgi:SAM-dependent methyltransferase
MNPTPLIHSADPFAQFKNAQREGWSLFAPLELITTPSAAKLVQFAGVREGLTLLDVGCGTGVVGVTAARRGARVTGLDLTPALLERAKENAQLAEVSIEFLEGDVEHLPFGDKTFDMVLSQFGHMFAPQPTLALAEMLRVLKPGGVIAFSTWPPELFTGRMFSLVSQYLPPPAGAASPALWGDPGVIRERFGEAVKDIAFDRDRMSSPGLSLQHLMKKFVDTAGPVVKLMAALKDKPEQRAKFQSAFQALLSEYFQDNILRQDFLMTRAIKK